MGHQLNAIIGKMPINEERLRYYQLAVAYESGWAIVILDADSMWYWDEKLGISAIDDNESIRWVGPLVFHFAKELGMQQFAIIETDYFSGMGEQSASLFDATGKAVIANKSINEVLKALGVEKTITDTDEFDAIRLGAYRATEYYYWDTNNFAAGKTNMITGSIPKS